MVYNNSIARCGSGYIYKVSCHIMICSCTKRYAVALISPYAQY